MPKSFPNLQQLFSDTYDWLCKSRKNHPPGSDLWDFKRTWSRQADAIMESFKAGVYRLGVQKKIKLSCGETIALWSSADALIIIPFLVKMHDCLKDRNIINYVWRFLNRCVEWGGLYQDFNRGIPRGASLSPLLGAFYLLELDRKMAEMDIKYFRYMDDILILAPTRWKFKKAIRRRNAMAR